MKNILFIYSLSLILTSCSNQLSPSARFIQSADYRQVEKCNFVGDVEGSSGMGNLLATTGMRNAKIEAQEQAVGYGATHIIWTGVAGGVTPFATGKAYKCKDVENSYY